jgi:aconitate hydratase
MSSSTPQTANPFGARSTLKLSSGEAAVYRLDALSKAGLAGVERLPYSLKVLLESALRNLDGYVVTEEDVKRLATWNAPKPAEEEIPFLPARVVLQDFTGVPCVVDLAAMRSHLKRTGGDPRKINPQVPVDLVIDHSVQVDRFGSADALSENTRIEFERNLERYQFLRWGQKAFDNFRVVPPATGIIHQVNLELLSPCVQMFNGVLLPDSLVGTDSHTTMINGLGVVGWGVGGIEAEAVMLRQPIYMLLPQVIGFKLTGALREGVTATDLVLTVTQILRKAGVVDKFVEFYGAGLSNISVADRATIANMAPEYGATVGFFPVDAGTLEYLRLTGRPADVIDRTERYCKEQGLFRTDASPDPVFTATLSLDLSSVEPSLAGPKRPQDRVSLSNVKGSFNKLLTAPVKEQGFALAPDALAKKVGVNSTINSELTHGSVVIAAITSCTNTSNPSVMVAAGLVAKKAVEKGLRAKPYVKTSLAPGSRVVSDYLDRAGLTPYLDKLNFQTVGYGCTTCIGNSGPLPTAISDALAKAPEIVAASVLSGNRNFEGRVHPQVKANYLASPPLVVAYALAGRVDLDLTSEPLGTGSDGKPVYLKDIWPTQKEIADAVAAAVTPEAFRSRYATVFTDNPQWNAITGAEGDTYGWDKNSTYVNEPPYFQGMAEKPGAVRPIQSARVLVMVGDSVTTDHISPAGDISEKSPAGSWLKGRGVSKADFNSYGARRGHDLVMTRGTFANVRLKNLLVPGVEGGVTTHIPSGEVMSIFDASVRYKEAGTPLVVLAGKDYGMGSSRDWAAKGTLLLGVRAVIAESFERIHRSNLVGMGVLPLVYKPGTTRESLGLTGKETFDIVGLGDDIKPRQELTVVARGEGGVETRFPVVCRIDTPVEVDYYKNGGILPAVLRKLAKA